MTLQLFWIAILGGGLAWLVAQDSRTDDADAPVAETIDEPVTAPDTPSPRPRAEAPGNDAETDAAWRDLLNRLRD